MIFTDFPVWEPLAPYRQCWSLEYTFGSWKTRGFDLKRIGITWGLERLFGLVILAWAACLRIGIWLAKQDGVKGHRRKALSLVQYVAETLVKMRRWNSGRPSTPAVELIQPFPALNAV